MKARIVSNRDIVIDNITAWEEEIVRDRFTAIDPNAKYIDNYLPKIRYNPATRRLARPFLGELKALCKVKDLALAIDDERPPSQYQPIPIEQIGNDFLSGITLKDFQVDAIKRVYVAECGIFSVTVGGGKGELIAAICKVIPCPTVIIAEQLIIIDQLRRRLMLRSVCEEPGLFYAGKMPSGELIIIGSIQSLVTPGSIPDKPECSNYKDEKRFLLACKRHEASLKGFRSRVKKSKLLHSLISKCDMILVDECDLAISKTYKSLFRYWFNGRRRYGFSGTPYDIAKPVEKLLLQEHLGSVIYHQSRDQVEATGLIVPIEYHMIAFGEDEDKQDAAAYDLAVNEYIVYNPEFHQAVKAICDLHPDEGTLILVDRDDLGYAFEALIPGSALIHGMTPKKARPEILGRFERREIKVLIGGKNVRRGMDLAGGCENLVLATGGKLISEFEQRIGRARRRNSAGRARVYDFLFLCNRYLYAHSRGRLRAIVEMGHQSEVRFRNGVVDGAAFVRSRFRRPKFGASRRS